MGKSSTKLKTLEDLFIHELSDLYDAEMRMLDALPKLAEAAHDPKLKAAFKEHREQTIGQAKRLEEVFADLKMDAERHTCHAMEGLIEEGEEVIELQAPADVKDAALIGAAQRVEHYEMAGYGTAHAFAEQLGHTHAAKLLKETLAEESKTNKTLTTLSKSINSSAAS